MGEVYRARDTRLDRSVAIKILPPDLAADTQLRERFEREARAISSLHHPHICALYDVGVASVAPLRADDGGTAFSGADTIHFLVLELLEGETLEARLRRSGPLSVSDAIKIALQVCEALNTAHAAGIVHRDLKPGNVFLERVGSAALSVKLLDFGLAKAASPVDPALAASLPTTLATPAMLTAPGMILGTFQYMAPEQVEGVEADARADIFAFGALLFEMLTGRRPFEGRTRAALLGAILRDDPPAASGIAPAVPTGVDRVIATCLAKDPSDRWQSARDLAHALQLASVASTAAAAPALQGRRILTPAAIGAGLILAVAAGAAGLVLGRLQHPSPDASPIAFTIAPPPGASFITPPGGGTGVAAQVAISPDGRRTVFVAEGSQGYGLWVRETGATEARQVPGTNGSAFPFWSPDSRSIGFFASGKLKKVSIAGGGPQDVCDSPNGRGGTWNSDDIIVFSPSASGGLQRVSAAGGTPVAISQLDEEYGETSHRFPWFLPDGRHFLYTATVGTCCPPPTPARVKVGALDTPDVTTLMPVESAVAYGAGYLLFNREGTLMAQPFDASTRSLRGDAFPVVDGVIYEGSRYASFSVSESGALAYARGVSLPTAQLTWLDRSGRPLQTIGEPAAYATIALSPDDRTVATSFRGVAAEIAGNLHLIDAATGDNKRATFERPQDYAPIWAPDAQRLMFVGRRDGALALIILKIASLQEEVFLPLSSAQSLSTILPSGWSRDGQYLVGTELSGASRSSDVWTLSLDTREKRAYVATPAQEANATFSPDGKWVAYELTQAGLQDPQIFVRRFPPTDEKHQISTAGGVQPAWSPNGDEIFFLTPTGETALMSAEVALGEVFRSRRPRRLFPVQTVPAGFTRHYAVSRDARRFLVAVRQPMPQVPLTVVVNWRAHAK